MFVISGLTVVVFVFFALALPEQAGALFEWLLPALTSTFDWFFLVAANIFVLVCVALMISPLGKVRLGGMDAKPDYSYSGWFAMLFAAGMGIGLMFFGVAEPIEHFTTSLADDAGTPDSWAPLAGAVGDAVEARRLGMAATIFHWGLHPWAIYAIVGLSLALFTYNKGLPLSVRSMFYPIFGERVWGWTGHVIDTLAVFATLFGLATSLGIGAEQANAGLEFLFGVPVNDVSKVVLIIGITAIALGSVVLGMDAGVKRLSEINMILAALLLLFVIGTGPTVAIATGFFANLVAYLEYLPTLSNPFGRADDNFRQGWTAFYWAWWISWSPFVGMFIARISRGRTVREFILCVLLIPSVVSVLWMTAFGGTAVGMLSEGYQTIADAPLELKLFSMLDNMALAGITSFLAIVLVIVFFVTSSDFGIAGDRHHHRRRQGGCAGGAARVLGQLRGLGGDSAPAGRRARRPAGGIGLDRAAVRSRAAARLLCPRQRPLERAASVSSAQGQAVERHGGRAPGDQVGDDARRAARHGPAHVAVAGIVIEVAIAAAADDRRTVRRHRPQAGPVARLREIAGVRIEIPERAEHAAEVGRPVAGIVARELGDRGDPDAIAQARIGAKIVLVDAADGGRTVGAVHRDRHRVALDRVDGDPLAERSGQQRAVAAERQDEGVRRQLALVGDRPLDPVARGLEPPHGGVEQEAHAALGAQRGQRLGELVGIAAAVGRAIDAARDLALARRQRRVDRGGAVAVDHLDRLTAFLHDAHVGDAALERFLAAVHVQQAAPLLVAGDAGRGDQVVQDLLGIAAKAMLDARVGMRARGGALAEELQRPAPEGGIGARAACAAAGRAGTAISA